MSSQTIGGKFGPGAEVRNWDLPRLDASESGGPPEAVDYNFVPLFGGKKEVAMTLEGAKQEAERLRAEARSKADRLLEEAAGIKAKAHEVGRAEGFEQGHREGQARGLDEGRGEYEKAVSSVLSTFKKVEDLYQELWAVNEAGLVKLAVKVAERVMFHELSTSIDSITAAFKACLDLLQEQHQAVFRMHPDDLGTLNQVRDEVRRKIDGLVKISLEPDEDLSPGDLVMETESGRVDATLRHRIEAVAGAVDEALKDGFDLEW